MFDEQRWRKLITGLCDGRLNNEYFRLLAASYSESHRHYHNISHIEHCLTEFDAAIELADYRHELEFALWLHDAVYNPHALDNEEKSASWAMEILSASCCPAPVANRIRDLILVTKHNHAPQSNDAKLIVDIDLSILGQAPDIYEKYEKNIRAEYSWVPADAYKVGRSNILRSFLDRPSIYITDRFQSLYGKQAKFNLTIALAVIEDFRE
jgi:predicted metal-dependent HD superfamily phosphohydrolase